MQQLAAWTICSSCCEAHLSKVACPRCTGTTSRAAHKRVEIPAAAQAPKPAPRIEHQRPDRTPAKKAPVGVIVSVLLFFTGVMLVAFAKLPALGIVLCSIPVVVQAVLRTRERKAERQGLAANLGIPLH